MDVFNGYRQHFLQKGWAQFAIHSRQQDSHPVFSGKDEVCLNITDSSPPIDDCRPQINEYAVFEPGDLGALSPPSPLTHEVLPARFDPAAIDAFQESFDRVRRDAGKISLMLLDAPRNTFRGSAFPELLFNECPQLGIRYNLHPLVLGLPSAHICFMVGLSGIICSFNPVSPQFIRDSGYRSSQCSRD